MKKAGATRPRNLVGDAKAVRSAKKAEPLEQIGRDLERHLKDYSGAPIEQTEHDANVDLVTGEGFRATSDFLHACGKVALWRLKNGELADSAGFYINEVMEQLAQIVCELVEAGDLMTARRLPLTVALYQRALAVYGPGICNSVNKRDDIQAILKRHKARALLEMVAALHPDWDSILHIPDRRRIEAMSEEQLRELLLSIETVVLNRDGKKTEELRSHRIAEVIENIIKIRRMEAANVNLFVEHLRRGWLWCGPKETFKRCPWNGRSDLPPVGNWPAWRALVVPFLKEETGGDASRLHVFEYLLAARRYVYAGGTETGGRLAGDAPTFIWNQVENRIGKAWTRMTRQEVKRNSRKPA